MKKEELLSRISELENQKLQCIAQVNAIDGAIQDCRYWLGELSKENKEEVVVPNCS